MPTLSTHPGSITNPQKTRLITAARDVGIDVTELRSMIGTDSIRKLSRKEASDWIARISGQPLPNPPGEKPSAYAGRSEPGVTRIITDDHVDQIDRMSREHFGSNGIRAADWLQRNFSVRDPRELATARRAGEVIRVLKQMLARTPCTESPSC